MWVAWLHVILCKTLSLILKGNDEQPLVAILIEKTLKLVLDRHARTRAHTQGMLALVLMISYGQLDP
jgi:hypothetical protein